MDDDILTPEQVAEMLGLSTGTLTNYRVCGGGPKHFRLGYRTVRYMRSDVEAWIKQKYEETTQGGNSYD